MGRTIHTRRFNRLQDVTKDYGIYQAYGKHTVYGKDVL